MLLADPNFAWPVCNDGYAWRNAKSSEGDGRSLVLAAISDRVESQYPLQDDDFFLRLLELHKQLKSKSADDQRALIAEFANRFGLLTGDVSTESEWGWGLVTFAVAVEIWRAWRDQDTPALRRVAESVTAIGLPRNATAFRTFRNQQTLENAHAALVEIVNLAPLSIGDERSSHLALRLTSVRLKTGDHRFDVLAKPSSLLSAAWMQFLDAVRQHARCNECPTCHRGFVVMPGRDYDNQMYCGRTCKQKAWRHGETRPRRRTRRKRGRN